MSDGFWDGIAVRVRPTDTLKTIENPRVIVRAVTAGMLGGSAQLLIAVGVFGFFGEVAVAWYGVVMAAAFFIAWVWFAVTGSVFTAVVIALVTGTAGNVYAHVQLGGYANSGSIYLFGIMLVVSAALFLEKRTTIITAVVTVVIGVVLAFFEESLKAGRSAPSQTLTTILFVFVLVGGINLLSPLELYFMGRLRYERERAESLLLNVLPAPVASELKETGHTQARRYDEISVLFADIVGFTPLAATMEPEEVVARLNDVFTYFDTLAEKHNVEKIRTIGDSYMVASGVPTPRDDHAKALAAMALDMLDYADAGPLSFRIGINSGPVVAGVIGTQKFQYDVWGDTVNVASRMESHGEPGRIQISGTTQELVREAFVTTQRGLVDIKGKGSLSTWWLGQETTEIPLRSSRAARS